MPKTFKYDVVRLIEGVKERPCLWDKTIENYKDRVERRAAWEEIFSTLDEGYDGMSWEEKRIMGEVILNKWTNIRDTFVKTLKTKMGKPKKKYFFHDQLKFLTKVIPEEECNIDYTIDEIPSTYVKQESKCEESTTKRRKSKKVDHADDYVAPKKSKRSDVDDRSQDDDVYESYDLGNDNVDFVEVNDNDARVMNEDEAFFASLLPSVVRYSEDERLEFRMEVLSVMKRIRDKKKWPGDD